MTQAELEHIINNEAVTDQVQAMNMVGIVVNFDYNLAKRTIEIHTIGYSNGSIYRESHEAPWSDICESFQPQKSIEALLKQIEEAYKKIRSPKLSKAQ